MEIEIQGTLHLYISRYLHLVSNLQVQHWRKLDDAPLSIDFQAYSELLEASHNIIPSNNSTPLTAITQIPIRAAKIHQSRRMRSHELHYIDHPLVGIIVRARPYLDKPITPR